MKGSPPPLLYKTERDSLSAEIGASPLRTRLRTVLETFALTRLKAYFKLENLDARMYLLVTRYVQMLKVVYVV